MRHPASGGGEIRVGRCARGSDLDIFGHLCD